MALLVRVSNLRNIPQYNRDTDLEYLKQDLVQVMTFVLRASRDSAGSENISLAVEHMDRCRIWIELLLETKAISKYTHLQLSQMADHIYKQLLGAYTQGDSSLRKDSSLRSE